jgi:hypothetical protein
VTIWWLIRLRLAMWTLRAAWTAAKWAAALALAAALLPVTLITLAGVGAAWLRGWPPARLYRAALLALPAALVYLAAAVVVSRSPAALYAWPASGWYRAFRDVQAGRVLAAAVRTAPLAVPAGLAAAGLAWARRIRRVESGLARRPSAPAVFDARQWRRQATAARAAAATPGAAGLLDGRGRIVIGPVIRTVGGKWAPVLAIPHADLGRHQVIIGASGAGKTNLMLRTWAGWHAAARHAWAGGTGDRPLLVAIDCKGGPDARAKADRARRLLRAAGERVAIWPDEATLSLWDLPPRALAVTLFQMIATASEGPAAYYADITQAILTLAVTAPEGPPAGAAALLARLDAGWLAAAWAGHPAEAAAVTAARRELGGIALRVRALLGRLGPALDGPGRLGDADAWYCIVEGTAEQTVAEAQALALTELVAHAATSPDTERRAMLLAVDDYSAVSGRVPLWQLYERGRSLGVGVQVSAQSWHGLAPTEDERYRIAATADGGAWLMRTPYPEPLARLAGTRRLIETATKLVAAGWGDEGSARLQHAWTADPQIARSLATGQAGYIRAGTCTWVQVTRPRPSPLALPPPGPGDVPRVIPAAAGRPAGLPGPASLDDAFGPRGSR